MPVEFVGGLRVSSAETVEVAKMVLVGKVNKDIVSRLGRHGQPAIGLCGDDGLSSASPPWKARGRGHRLRRPHRARRRRRGAPRRRGLHPGHRLGGPDRDGRSTTSTRTRRPARWRARWAPTRCMFLTDVRRLAARPGRPGLRHLRPPRPTRSRPRYRGHRRWHAAQAGRRASTPSTAASPPPTSSTAGSRTRCCSSSSPTPGSARRCSPPRSTTRADAPTTPARPSSSCAARARGCGTPTGTSTSTSWPASRSATSATAIRASSPPCRSRPAR